MTCVRGLLQRADGSVQWSQEGTSVIAAVYGPQAAQARSENDERAIVEVVFKPRSGLAGLYSHQAKVFVACLMLSLLLQLATVYLAQCRHGGETV